MVPTPLGGLAKTAAGLAGIAKLFRGPPDAADDPDESKGTAPVGGAPRGGGGGPGARVFVTNWPKGIAAAFAGGGGSEGGGSGIGGIGGIIGKALGGAGGKVGGGIADSLGSLGGIIAKFASGVFNVQLAVQGLMMLGKSIAALPAAPIHAFTAAINLVNAPVLAVVGALKGFVGAVGAVGSAVSDFVKLSNPIYVVKFNLAMDDLMATIGKVLTPILEASTTIVRAFADVIFRLADPFQKLMKAFIEPFMEEVPKLLTFLTPVIDLIGSFVGILADVLKPLMKVMVYALEGLAAAFALLAGPIILPVIIGLVGAFVGILTTLAIVMGPVIAVFAAIGYVVQKLMTYAAGLLGIKSAAGGSVGAAVRPATIGGVEEYGKKAQQAAFSLGTAAGPAEKSADYLEKIYVFLERNWLALVAILDKFPKTPGEALSQAGEALGVTGGSNGRDSGRYIGEFAAKATAVLTNPAAAAAGLLFRG